MHDPKGQPVRLLVDERFDLSEKSEHRNRAAIRCAPGHLLHVSHSTEPDACGLRAHPPAQCCRLPTGRLSCVRKPQRLTCALSGCRYRHLVSGQLHRLKVVAALTASKRVTLQNERKLFADLWFKEDFRQQRNNIVVIEAVHC